MHYNQIKSNQIITRNDNKEFVCSYSKEINNLFILILGF